MSAQPRILVFDSGVGALSIIAELRRRLPAVAITYASDNGFFPYGQRGETELVERVQRVLQSVLAREAVDLVVIACNTASTVALPHIRQQFPVPIVGVVPAIKPAARHSRSKVIGLLGTPGTVARPYTRTLIEQFAADCQVIPLGSSELVTLAEAKLRGAPPDAEPFEQILRPIREHRLYPQMDTVVLACTHFPLLREELQRNLHGELHWVDSGEAIARRVASLLEPVDATAAPWTNPVAHRSVFTRQDPELEALLPGLATYLPGPVEFVSFC